MSDSAEDLRAPTRMLLSRISNRVTLEALLELEQETREFSQLRAAIRVSPQALSRALRELERDGLVERVDQPADSPRLEYRLSALGTSLCKPLALIRGWAEAYADEILAAHETFERDRSTNGSGWR